MVYSSLLQCLGISWMWELANFFFKLALCFSRCIHGYQWIVKLLKVLFMIFGDYSTPFFPNSWAFIWCFCFKFCQNFDKNTFYCLSWNNCFNIQVVRVLLFFSTTADIVQVKVVVVTSESAPHLTVFPCWCWVKKVIQNHYSVLLTSAPTIFKESHLYHMQIIL